MGYFANGSEGDAYEARFCKRCAHGDWTRSDDHRVTVCAVMELHLMRNYDDCNDASSALHVLIPRDGIENQQCRMFLEAGDG